VATSLLSVPGHPSVRAAALLNVLHVLVTDHAGATAAHLLVDEHAQPIGRLPDLQLTIISVEGCADELLVTGEDALGRVLLVSLNSDGSERWRAPLAVGPVVTRAPRVLWAAGQAIVAWEETEDDQCVLLVSSVRAKRCDPPRRFVLSGVTLQLDFVLTPAGLVIARLSGFPPRCSLLRLDGNNNLTHVDLDDVNAGQIAIAPAAAGVALAWAEGQSVGMQQFDSSLRPVGEPVSLSIPGGTIKRLCGYGPGRPAFVATAWQGKRDVRGLSPTEHARSQVLLDDSVVEVPLPVGWIETGAWLGETFVLIHGAGPMAASAFSVVTDHG
jgi:hypothetical protein